MSAAAAIAPDPWAEHLASRRAVMAQNMRRALHELHARDVPVAWRAACPPDGWGRAEVELRWARADLLYEQGMRDGGSPELAALLEADAQLYARRCALRREARAAERQARPQRRKRRR